MEPPTSRTPTKSLSSFNEVLWLLDILVPSLEICKTFGTWTMLDPTVSTVEVESSTCEQNDIKIICTDVVRFSL